MIDTKELFEDSSKINCIDNIIQICNDYVLIKPIEEERKSKGGIFIPDSVANINNTSKGLVLKTGDGSYDDATGEFNPISVKEGDTVIYDSNAIIHKHEEWDNNYLIKEIDIITVIDERITAKEFEEGANKAQMVIFHTLVDGKDSWNTGIEK